jgi:hypothetical protein
LRREKIAAINFAKIEKKLKINMSSVIWNRRSSRIYVG